MLLLLNSIKNLMIAHIIILFVFFSCKSREWNNDEIKTNTQSTVGKNYWKNIGGGTPTPGIAAAVRSKGYTFLEHQTNLTKLVSIVKSGGLLTGEAVPVNPTGIGYGSNIPGKTFFLLSKQPIPYPASREASYSMSCSFKYPKDEPIIEKGDKQAAIVIADIDAMEGALFHISRHGMTYGEWYNGDYRSSDDLQSLQNALTGLGEVVFYHSIPIEKIRAFWVHPTQRQWVLDEFKKNNIQRINGTEIEEFLPCAK